MSILDDLRELGWPLPKCPEDFEEQEFDPHTGEGKVFLYETDACNFEVLDGETWYKVDAEHPLPELYEETDVPSEIVVRARKALDAIYDKLDWREDPTPAYLEALRREFDDARFVNMTILPGVIY